ncbi:hypothetical protein P8C59_006033 [Phyllachora maydis]|uniref:Uncharacterized protein n=1 Tax=Phyllachora maydis TaxID=1825666 RepID=A0AAD9ME43_9PEZI|nr:hypothetical protein P8C59_006033 [Phyllachora maydis]
MSAAVVTKKPASSRNTKTLSTAATDAPPSTAVTSISADDYQTLDRRLVDKIVELAATKTRSPAKADALARVALDKVAEKKDASLARKKAVPAPIDIARTARGVASPAVRTPGVRSTSTTATATAAAAGPNGRAGRGAGRGGRPPVSARLPERVPPSPARPPRLVRSYSRTVPSSPAVSRLRAPTLGSLQPVHVVDPPRGAMPNFSGQPRHSAAAAAAPPRSSPLPSRPAPVQRRSSAAAPDTAKPPGTKKYAPNAHKPTKAYAPDALKPTARLVGDVAHAAGGLATGPTDAVAKVAGDALPGGLGRPVQGAADGVQQTLGATTQGASRTLQDTTGALGRGDVLGAVDGLTGGVGDTVGGLGKGLVSRNAITITTPNDGGPGGAGAKNAEAATQQRQTQQPPRPPPPSSSSSYPYSIARWLLTDEA